jgi:hypothetical protein
VRQRLSLYVRITRVLSDIRSWARRDPKSARRILDGIVFATALLLGGDLLNGHLTAAGWVAIGIFVLALVADTYLWRFQRADRASAAPGQSDS